ncbi:MAG: ABC transporter permease subunit [Exilispira sp.]|nr:ABC transporter permease subunit [Exilispira sp.]
MNFKIFILNIINSFYRLIVSVSIGVLLGFFFGLLISFLTSMKFMEKVLLFFMSIPGISWAPLFLIIFGFGNKTIIITCSIAAFFPFLYNVYHGLKEVKKEFDYLGDIFEYPFLKKLIKIYIPSILNYIFIGLKLSFARTWRTVIAVEMIAAYMYGLGYIIFNARELLNTQTMFAGIFYSGILYFIIEYVIIAYLEKISVFKWGMKEKYE